MILNEFGVVNPKFYPSWIKNNEKNIWEAPVPYPTDGKTYSWDEQTTNWLETK